MWWVNLAAVDSRFANIFSHLDFCAWRWKETAHALICLLSSLAGLPRFDAITWRRASSFPEPARLHQSAPANLLGWLISNLLFTCNRLWKWADPFAEPARLLGQLASYNQALSQWEWIRHGAWGSDVLPKVRWTRKSLGLYTLRYAQPEFPSPTRGPSMTSISPVSGTGSIGLTPSWGKVLVYFGEQLGLSQPYP